MTLGCSSSCSVVMIGLRSVAAFLRLLFPFALPVALFVAAAATDFALDMIWSEFNIIGKCAQKEV